MTDDSLLALLAAALHRHDPVPPSATAAALASGAQSRPAGGPEPLALVADGPVVTGLRGGGPVLGFAGAGGTIDVELTWTEADPGDRPPGRVRLAGLVTMGSPASDAVRPRIEVRWPGGCRTVGVDRFGRFGVDGVPAGPLSIAMSLSDAEVVTPWFVA